MSTFSPRFLDEIRIRLTLSEIIGKRVSIKRAGREFKGCCPFHKEKSPSFYVNDDKQFYHCFGCGAHGDVIGFVMQHDNLSFPETVESLAGEAGLDIPKTSPAEAKKAAEEKSLYTLLDDATKFFEAGLFAAPNRDIYAYVKDRGMSDEHIGAYRIGYAPEDGRELIKFLLSKDYKPEQMVEAGVARLSKRDNSPYAFFRDRVIFPVSDKRGRVVAFGGRVLPEQIRPAAYSQGKKPPKYINSSDSPLFHKGRMLYGEAHARQAAQAGGRIIVVEGYVDAIACARAGYKGAVAPLGTALTEDQILLLWKMMVDTPKTPILCFDGDNAGRRAAERAVERILPLLKPDHSVKMAFLPQGEDPDSLIKVKGKKAFEDILNSALPLIDFLWQSEISGRNLDTPEEKAGLSKDLKNRVNQISDRTVQHYYNEAIREKVREKFSTKNRSEGDYRSGGGSWQKSFKGNGFNKFNNKFNKSPAHNIAMRRPAAKSESLEPVILLAAMINHPKLFEEFEEKFCALQIEDPTLDHLRQQIILSLESETELDIFDMKGHLVAHGLESDLDRVLNSTLYMHAGFAKPTASFDVVRKGWLQTWESIINKQQQHELQAAARAFQIDMNDENFQRWQSLLKQQEQLRQQDES